MLRIWAVAVVLLLLLFAKAGLAASAVERDAEKFLRGWETQTFQRVNQLRREEGLPGLKWSEEIARLARGHSRGMATGEVSFGHDGFGDRIKQLKALTADFRGAGENVFKTGNSVAAAEQAVEAWRHSPHHLRNMRGDYNLSAIGVAEAKDGTLYFTQIFLRDGK